MYEASNAQTRMNIESMIRVFLSSPSPLPATRTRHEDDLYAWAQEQAGFLRQGAWSALDLEHLSEEIEDVAHSQEDKLISHLLILLTHLLKLTLAAQHLPLDYTRAARGWRLTCRTQRLQIAKVLRRNPRLRPTVPKELQDTYAVARLEAAGALEIEEGAVPTSCPWTADQVLSDTFWPDTPQESQPTDAR
jgi:hypothetical protein